MSSQRVLCRATSTLTRSTLTPNRASLLALPASRTLTTTQRGPLKTRQSPLQGYNHRSAAVSRPSPSKIEASKRLLSSDSSTGAKIYSFEEIKSLTTNPSKSHLLIDVREPSELLSTGTIPTAQNVPVASAPDAFFLPAAEFKDRFGFAKPASEGLDAPEVIFFCKAGVRSRAAAELASQAGYRVVGNYGGSWLDWEKKGGEKVKWSEP